MAGTTLIRGELRPAMSGNQIGKMVSKTSVPRIPTPPNRIPSSITNRKKGTR